MTRTMVFSTFLALFFLSGCISKTIVKPVYPFEGRYSDKTDIQIDGQKIKIPKGKSIWVLSNDTLFNVIDSARSKK